MTPLEQFKASLEHRFRCEEYGTNLRQECWAGLTNFLVIAYIVIIGPKQLALHAPGVDGTEIAVATCLGSAAMCFLMGLLTNRPFVLAPGLGIIAIVGTQLIEDGMFTWPQAMAAVFLQGVLAVGLLLLGLHSGLVRAIPSSLKNAIALGIGCFIMVVGLHSAHLIEDGQVVISNRPEPWIAVTGFTLTVILYSSPRLRNFALLSGIVVSTALSYALPGVELGVPEPKPSAIPDLSLSLPGLTGIASLSDLKAGVVAMVVLSILLTDVFDSIGTTHTLAEQVDGAVHPRSATRTRKVLFVDALGAVVGGAIGASSITTYVESAAGIGSGGRTGLTAIVTGIGFLLALGISGAASWVPEHATAPALMMIGFLMTQAMRNVEWTRPEENIPALLVLLAMVLTDSITNGIGFGFIAYAAIAIIRRAGGGEGRLHPLMLGTSFLFLLHFTLLFRSPVHASDVENQEGGATEQQDPEESVRPGGLQLGEPSGADPESHDPGTESENGESSGE